MEGNPVRLHGKVSTLTPNIEESFNAASRINEEMDRTLDGVLMRSRIEFSIEKRWRQCDLIHGARG